MQQYDKLIIGRGDYTLSFYKKVVYKESGTTKTKKKKKKFEGSNTQTLKKFSDLSSKNSRILRLENCFLSIGGWGRGGGSGSNF